MSTHRPADRRPEHTKYTDTGCIVSPSCFTCPLVRCKYEEPHNFVRSLRNKDRNAEIIALRRAGHTAQEVAERFGISRRSVFHVQQKALA